MNSNEAEEREKEVGKKVIEAVLKNDRILIEFAKDVETLSSKGYGVVNKDGTLTLAFYEAMYLQSRGLIKVSCAKTNETLSFQDLFKKYRAIDEDAWIKYLIYRDLRSRGYVIREGFGLGADFRLYERGKYSKDSADYLVYGVYEGMPLSIENLTQILKRVQNLKKALILAVINRRGEIVYYSLSQMNF